MADNKVVSFTQKKVKNKGKVIGTLTSYNDGIRKTLPYAGIAIAFTIGFIVGNANNKPERYPINYNTLSESYFDEPTYNGISYTIQYGDTLSGIVSRYESDGNKVERIIRQIEELNRIDRNDIKAGTTILLCGVPSSFLEMFGYTDNYNYFDASVEADLRIRFLTKVADSVNEFDTAQDYISEIAAAINAYLNYSEHHIPGDDEALNDIMFRLTELCREAKNYGYSFENNLQAIPLNEAKDYNKTQGM